MTRRLIVVSSLCLAVLAVATPALAQPLVQGLKIGQQVRVTDTGGERVTGRVSAIGPDSLTVDGRTFPIERVERVERKGDSLWNGLAIGAAFGALLPLVPSEACAAY